MTCVWSLIGFVLARAYPNRPPNGPGGYDLVVAFRGSRSGDGSITRLTKTTFRKTDPNPDWQTNREVSFKLDPDIAARGDVHLGFATAVKTMSHPIRECVAQAYRDMNGPPTRVFVTGHSLGGALATCFASSVLLGNNSGSNLFGPKASQLPADAQGAWRGLQLVTFGAPPVGGKDKIFKKSFDSAVGARGYRLKNDLVPWALGNGVMTGLDIILDGTEKGGAAHNPKTIRHRLEQHLQPSGRNPDGHTPWTEGHNIQNVLQDLQQFVQTNAPGNNPPGTQLPYRFRDGLIQYLTAFANMKSRDDPQRDRFVGAERQSIYAFLDHICPPPNPSPTVTPVNWLQSDQNRLPLNLGINFNAIANLGQIQEQEGMTRMLKHWLALIMTQVQVAPGFLRPDQGWFEL